MLKSQFKFLGTTSFFQKYGLAPCVGDLVLKDDPGKLSFFDKDFSEPPLFPPFLFGQLEFSIIGAFHLTHSVLIPDKEKKIT